MPPKPKTTRWSKVHKAASNKLFALGAAKGGADHLRVMRDDFEHIKAVYQAEVSKGSVLSQIPYKNFRINFAKAANAYSGYLSMNGIRLEIQKAQENLAAEEDTDDDEEEEEEVDVEDNDPNNSSLESSASVIQQLKQVQIMGKKKVQPKPALRQPEKAPAPAVGLLSSDLVQVMPNKAGQWNLGDNNNCHAYPSVDYMRGYIEVDKPSYVDVKNVDIECKLEGNYTIVSIHIAMSPALVNGTLVDSALKAQIDKFCQANCQEIGQYERMKHSLETKMELAPGSARMVARAHNIRTKYNFDPNAKVLSKSWLIKHPMKVDYDGINKPKNIQMHETYSGSRVDCIYIPLIGVEKLHKAVEEEIEHSVEVSDEVFEVSSPPPRNRSRPADGQPMDLGGGYAPNYQQPPNQGASFQQPNQGIPFQQPNHGTPFQQPNQGIPFQSPNQGTPIPYHHQQQQQFYAQQNNQGDPFQLLGNQVPPVQAFHQQAQQQLYQQMQNNQGVAVQNHHHQQQQQQQQQQQNQAPTAPPLYQQQQNNQGAPVQNQHHHHHQQNQAPTAPHLHQDHHHQQQHPGNATAVQGQAHLKKPPADPRLVANLAHIMNQNGASAGDISSILHAASPKDKRNREGMPVVSKVPSAGGAFGPHDEDDDDLISFGTSAAPSEVTAPTVATRSSKRIRAAKEKARQENQGGGSSGDKRQGKPKDDENY